MKKSFIGLGVFALMLSILFVGCKVSVTISLEESNGGIIVASPAFDKSGEFMKGSIVNFTAIPNEGYKVGKWKGATVSKDDPTKATLEVTSDVTVSVSFVEREKFEFEVSFSGGDGSTGSMTKQIFTEGVAQSLSANTFSKENYIFTNWVDDEGNSYTDEEEITVTKDISLTAEWSKGKSFTVGSVTFNMLNIEEVSNVTLGDNDQNNNEEHTVSLSEYFIGETEVTQELWQEVMESNPSKFQGNNLPVEQVSWYNCIAFCNKLTKKINGDDTQECVYYTDAGFTTVYESGTDVYMDMNKKGFRLPTEAEWEYAGRGGDDYAYAGSNNIEEVAWYNENSNNQTHDVKSKAPNGYKLYDMSGNVGEWCFDSSNFGQPASGNDPVTVLDPFFNCICRDGSYAGDSSSCVLAYRSSIPADYINGPIGLRLVGRF